MKSLLGDNSDNLSGVKGLGPKGIFKHFPDLIDKPGTDLEYVFEICEAGVEKTKDLSEDTYKLRPSVAEL
jgi:5'-3' exonuclease